MANLLIIDDDRLFSGFLHKIFTNESHRVQVAGTLGLAREALSKAEFDIVFLDVLLPDGNGLQFLYEILELPDAPEVLIITGMPDDEGAKTAVESGAWDYICKVDPLSRIQNATNNLLSFRKEKSLATARDTLRDSGIIGMSAEIGKVLDQAARAAKADSPILITGETGTGKEVFAKAIHHNSPFSGGQFVVVDCASTPKELIESLLFGHKKGAFTGALNDHEGLVALADGGTLFLDEIGELPLELQKVFLRVLQEKVFRPVGSPKEVKSNFRLISATNRDLEECVKEGTFRSDLFYRIKSYHIQLPPLRTRCGDITRLAKYFLSKHRDTSGSVKGFNPAIFEFLEAYDWPGNVRELHQVIEATILNSQGFPTVFPMHLPPNVRTRRGFGVQTEVVKQDAPLVGSIEMTLEEYRGNMVASAEKDYLFRLCRDTRGDMAEACKISGMSRSRLYALLDLHGISPKEARKRG